MDDVTVDDVIVYDIIVGSRTHRVLLSSGSGSCVASLHAYTTKNSDFPLHQFSPLVYTPCLRLNVTLYDSLPRL